DGLKALAVEATEVPILAEHDELARTVLEYRADLSHSIGFAEGDESVARHALNARRTFGQPQIAFSILGAIPEPVLESWTVERREPPGRKLEHGAASDDANDAGRRAQNVQHRRPSAHPRRAEVHGLARRARKRHRSASEHSSARDRADDGPIVDRLIASG